MFYRDDQGLKYNHIELHDRMSMKENLDICVSYLMLVDLSIQSDDFI